MKTRIRESMATGCKTFVCEYKTFLFWKGCNELHYTPYIRSYSSGYSSRQSAENRIKKFKEDYYR